MDVAQDYMQQSFYDFNRRTTPFFENPIETLKILFGFTDSYPYQSAGPPYFQNFYDYYWKKLKHKINTETISAYSKIQV